MLSFVWVATCSVYVLLYHFTRLRRSMRAFVFVSYVSILCTLIDHLILLLWALQLLWPCSNSRMWSPFYPRDPPLAPEPMSAPRLSQLRLRDVTLPFVATGLVELRVSFTKHFLVAEDTGRILVKMYQALSACHKLRVLQLEGTSDYVPDSSRAKIPVAYLPSLQTLEIEDTYGGLMWIWSRLSIPPEAAVVLHMPEIRSLDLAVCMEQLRVFTGHTHGPHA